MNARLMAIVSFLALAMICAAATPVIAAVRIFKLDAVELVKNGKEVDGDKKHTVVRDGYTYHFASAENKAAFEADPTRFEVQMGGACARMGPLSGSGNPNLFAVHDGRLYVFASPQCKAGFLKAPEKLIEKDDPSVKGDAAAIDAAKSYRQIRETVVTQGGAKYDYKYTTTIAFPDRIHDEFCWNDNCSWQTVDGSKGADWTGSGFDRPLAASQVRAVKRKVNVNLLSILKTRGRAGFAAAKVGEEKVGDSKVERVGVSIDGWTWILGVDSVSGRVRTLEYTGRGERDMIGNIVLTFVDYETAGGLTLPVSWSTSFDGKPGKEPIKLSKIEINAKIDDKLFAVDEPK